jgi:hypothetical protein
MPSRTMPQESEETEPTVVTTKPDPTTLTNQLVRSAVMALREVIESRIDGLEKITNERFISADGRIATNRIAWENRFELLDKQTIKAAADVKSAVDAAFAAAASGVAQQNQANFLASQKQENAFTKQIDQLAASVAQLSKANDDKLNDLKKTNDDKFGDLKDRLVVMEGKSSITDPSTSAALRDMAMAITTLKTSNDQGTGRRLQGSDSLALIFSIIAAVGVVCMLAFETIQFTTRVHG